MVNFHPSSYIDLIIIFIFYYFFVRNGISKRIFLYFLLSSFALMTFYWNFYEAPVSLFDIFLLREFLYLDGIGYLIKSIVVVFFLSIFASFLYIIYKCFRINFWTFSTFLIAIVLISNVTFGRIDWNPIENYRKQGLILTLVGDFSKKLGHVYVKDREDTLIKLYSKEVSIVPEKPINLVILESLFFASESSLEVFTKAGLSYKKVRVSTFAGESARSEFESLCGAPSLKSPLIEFNYISYDLNCLPRVLNDFGYNTTVINANRPWMYNAVKTYKYLGFEQQDWALHNNKEHILDKPGGYVYDGVVFDYALEKFEPNSKAFNYVVGSYGHYPYERNLKKRPDVVKIEGNQLNRIVNMSHYRNEEILTFFNAQSAFTIVCGDHQPFIEGYTEEDNFYTYCISNSDISRVENLYELPYFILSEITGDEKWLKLIESISEEYYFRSF
ncbi:hypothetical protein L1D15_13995 [Vibrio sp. Isolate25]|uniref:sulfatase-like hydrolase/transferase n=1 Tax=Vibrio sp. Isolate25 TaxID=2908535 RepID=UPI001EFC5910|nr:sulfatase-like hydrolase/transferase [Vibrio sp. Isolate25]MCG9597830.1 hypothetical protein [Vibrio sp. Isolate25]